MKTKRFLTILLGIILMLSLLPAIGMPAFADGGAYADYENNVNKPVTFFPRNSTTTLRSFLSVIFP